MDEFKKHVGPCAEYYERIANYKARARGLHRMLQKAPADFLNNIYAVIKNVNNGNIRITPTAKQSLVKYRKQVIQAGTNKRACKRIIKSSKVGRKLTQTIANIVNEAITSSCPADKEGTTTKQAPPAPAPAEGQEDEEVTESTSPRVQSQD